MGGSGTASNDPDIALRCFGWSSPRNSAGTGQQQQFCHSACRSGDKAAADHAVAPAPSATIACIPSPSPAPGPVLVRVIASQEGDVPAARIGHAAITLTNPSFRAPLSSTSALIYVFGGEAPNPSTADEDGPGPRLYPKFADVYEATPKATSGTLVWRALTAPNVPTPQDPTAVDTEPHVAYDFPAPVAFHASCAASVRGAERALLVHGGISQRSELLAELWAFFPARLSSSNGAEAAGEGGDGGSVHSNGERTTGWERLQPQGEG